MYRTNIQESAARSEIGFMIPGAELYIYSSTIRMNLNKQHAQFAASEWLKCTFYSTAAAYLNIFQTISTNHENSDAEMIEPLLF